MTTSRELIAGLRWWVPHFTNSLSRSRRLSTSLALSSSPADKRRDELKSKILGLKDPGRSAAAVIQNWVDQGGKVTVPELRHLSVHLLKSKRFHHALQILKWMESLETPTGFRLSPGDHAVRLELMMKVNGKSAAEEYFEQLNTASKKAACLPLLHSYVVERDVEKAEALMAKLGGMGLLVSPHPYNEMMKLYMGTSQFEKVPLVVDEMRSNKIPLTVLSYNIWINACAKLTGVDSVEMVYKEMLNDKNVQVGWSTLSTIAGIYMKAGLIDKAYVALRSAEQKLSTYNRLGYSFMITQYTSLGSKGDVLRVWKASKAVGGRIPTTNYMHMLLCLVKLGDIEEAERIFVEWESNCFRYDVRVPNVLLGAYMRNGMVEKAESLHLRTLERGGHPNYKTWEILMEGWLKNQNMEKAVEAMRQGFSMLQGCHWRPSEDTVMAFADYFERHQNIDDANWYVKVIHNLGFANLPLYKSLLRMHLSAQRAASDILKMMEKDKIEMDDETFSLVQTLKTDFKNN